MFETIRKNWTANLSHKKIQTSESTFVMSLNDLHYGAWTGLRVACLKEQVVSVTLKTRDEALETWSQPTNSLHPLPFPFPSWMAKEMDLMIEITQEDKIPMAVIAVFHEIDVAKKDRYLFVSDSGKPEYHWNGSSTKKEDIAFRQLHTRIPSISAILDGHDISIVCIHDLSETFPLT